MTTATKYKIYPKYKPSGLDWLGDIPVGWEVKRFGFLFAFNKGLSITKENLQDAGIPCVNYGEIHSKYGFEVDPLKNDLKCVSNTYLENNRGSILNFGDFVFADTSEDIEGAGNFTYLNSHEVTFAGYHTIITRQIVKINVRYLAYLFDSVAYRTQIRSSVAGIKVYSITKDILKNSYVLLPPSIEQKLIADFLDCETAKIDEMVEKKQKMMKLLKEKRQALITHAVTKGLDPKAKMKPSGVDWLGDIPEKWESWKIAHIFNKIGSGTTPPSDDMDYYEGDIPWVITGELKDNEIFDSENKVTKKAVKELSALKIFPKDSLLIAMYGATIGKMAILRIPATTNQACCILGDSKIVDTKFSFYYFLTFRPHLIALSYGGGQPNISQDTIKSIKLFLPIISEQKEVVVFLDRETTKIDEMMKKVEAQIEKLQEYRQALITSAVTGKIKI